MDMDLDELEDLGPAPSRSTRFSPKSSKFKPKPKTKPLKPEMDTSFILPSTKEESAEPLIAAIDVGNINKVEMESSRMTASTSDIIVKMDTDLKTEGSQLEEDLMEEDNHNDEDPVVREIDVFFTPSMDSNSLLYVIQYPLKPCWRPYELDEHCKEVRVKPVSSEVEIDLSIDLDSKNYDPDSNTGVRVTKQVLSSSWKLPCRSGYAVGVLKENKLHLNPVHAVVQLRPSMQHFESGALKGKNMGCYDEGAVKKEKSDGPSKKQNKQTEVLNEALKDSGENWIHLKYHGSKSDASSKYLQKMMAEEGSEIEFTMSPFDYVNSFFPWPSNRQGGPSKRYLLSLPLEDRFKTWLCKVAPIHRFDVLKYLAPSDSVEDLLKVLRKLCYLVQGLWVPKSSLLELQGLDALVRDYTLYLFSKSHCISKSDLPQKSKLKNAMENALRVFAVQRSALRDWKFKEPKDMSFVQLYPDIVKEQEQAWETRGEKLNAQIYGERSGHGLKNSPKTDRTGKLVSMENASRCFPKTLIKTPAKTTISDETHEALLKTLQKLFQSNKVCSFQRICQLLRDVAISKDVHAKGGALERSAAIGLDAPPEELRAIINQVAIDIHGVYVSRTSTEHSYDGLRKTVIDLLLVKGPNAKLRKATIIEAAKMALKREEIPMSEYNKVMSELCVSRGAVWVLKSGDRSSDDNIHS